MLLNFFIVQSLLFIGSGAGQKRIGSATLDMTRVYNKHNASPNRIQLFKSISILLLLFILISVEKKFKI